jgi:hypothetical protein
LASRKNGFQFALETLTYGKATSSKNKNVATLTFVVLPVRPGPHANLFGSKCALRGPLQAANTFEQVYFSVAEGQENRGQNFHPKKFSLNENKAFQNLESRF